MLGIQYHLKNITMTTLVRGVVGFFLIIQQAFKSEIDLALFEGWQLWTRGFRERYCVIGQYRHSNETFCSAKANIKRIWEREDRE